MTIPAVEPVTAEQDLICQFFADRREGFFVEVGANDPKALSQTWILEARGWKGILIEPLSRYYQALCQARPNSRVFQVACGAPGHLETETLYEAQGAGFSSLTRNLVDASTVYVGSETVRMLTLDEVLAQAGDPKLDFVSIDVEGMQFEVLKGFNLRRHRPALLLVEDHLHNLKSHLHLKRQGYQLVKRTGLNNWYVPKGTRLELTSWRERFGLWKKVWANTPFRKLKVLLEKKRARQP